MSSDPRSPRASARDSLSVELGNWFKARATGAGVFAIPFIILVVIGGAVARSLLG